MFTGFSTSPATQREREKRKQNCRLVDCGGQDGGSSEKADQARPKCRGWLAGAARRGSLNRFTDMTSVAPVHIFFGSFYHLPPEASSMLGNHRTTMKISLCETKFTSGHRGLPVNYKAPHPFSMPRAERGGNKPLQYCTFFNTEEPLNEAHCL